MIYEYAIDPSVLSSWANNQRDYAEFFREYGLGTPRVISSFPKKNVSKLRRYLISNGPQDSQSLATQRYTEMVKSLVESIVLRDVADGQSGNWLEDVVSENGRVRFDVVLSSVEVDIEKNITPDDMYSKDKANLWNHSCQISIQRTSSSFLSAISNLIRLSTKHVVIVDPYGWTAESINFITHLINSMSQDRLVDAVPIITLFYKEKRGGSNSGAGSPSANHVKCQILEGIEKLTNVQLEVVELAEQDGEDVFHNRCILTEHGGVITGHGIGVSGDENHTDDLILMESNIYEKRWKQFVEDSCFNEKSRA